MINNRDGRHGDCRDDNHCGVRRGGNRHGGDDSRGGRRYHISYL